MIKVGLAAGVSLVAAIGLGVIGDSETGSILAGVAVGSLLGGWLSDLRGS